MKVSDIQWKGTVIDFSYTDEEVKELPVESEVVIDYDSNCDKYFITVENKLFYLTPSISGKGALENLVKDVDKRKRISWILDITEKTISVKIIPFNSATFLNAFQSLQIEVSNSVVQQLKKSTSLEALSVLENQFSYKNVNGEKVIFLDFFREDKRICSFKLCKEKNAVNIVIYAMESDEWKRPDIEGVRDFAGDKKDIKIGYYFAKTHITLVRIGEKSDEELLKEIFQFYEVL